MIALLLATALATLPAHMQLHPQPLPHPARSITVSSLRSPVTTLIQAGSTTFAIPLAAAETGGIPRRLRAQIELLRPVNAGTGGLVQLRFNGALIGARELGRPGAPERVDVDIPAAFVGSANELRVTVGGVHDVLLAATSFHWNGYEDQPNTVADFLKIVHGRAVVLIDPAFAAAAANVLHVLAQMNPSADQVDVRPFDGTIPAGYDEALVFAQPSELAGRFALPIHGGDHPFVIVNPLDNVELVGRATSASAATIQVGHAQGIPILTFSYVGDPRAIERLARLSTADLAVQVGNVSLADADGVTAYEVGPKLRIIYPDDDYLLRDWNAIRLPLAVFLVFAIAGGGMIASRRLAQKPATAG